MQATSRLREWRLSTAILLYIRQFLQQKSPFLIFFSILLSSLFMGLRCWSRVYGFVYNCVYIDSAPMFTSFVQCKHQDLSIGCHPYRVMVHQSCDLDKLFTFPQPHQDYSHTRTIAGQSRYEGQHRELERKTKSILGFDRFGFSFIYYKLFPSLEPLLEKCYLAMCGFSYISVIDS